MLENILGLSQQDCGGLSRRAGLVFSGIDPAGGELARGGIATLVRFGHVSN